MALLFISSALKLSGKNLCFDFFDMDEIFKGMNFAFETFIKKNFSWYLMILVSLAYGLDFIVEPRRVSDGFPSTATVCGIQGHFRLFGGTRILNEVEN